MSTVDVSALLLSNNYLKHSIIDKLINVVDEGWPSDIANHGFENIAPA